jgi:hypothetical protein
MRALRFGLALALPAIVAIGGYATYPGNDKLVLALGSFTREFDEQLNSVLTALIVSAEIAPGGEVFLNRALGDRRFLEPDSGRYWQITGEGQEDFTSRSLGGREIKISGRKAWTEPFYYNSDQFKNEPLRIAERTVRLPGSDVDWQFVVARSRNEPD